MTGHVSIVGAGPGDPELLTRRAVARLRAANLVLYDALVDTRVLAFARRAKRFYVGKRASRHAMTQEAIHALMIRSARRGQRVVRLKGGDPFVLGRGGEEAIALRAAGISFDVVPGLTSAVAAPALAGIPVTHRGVASAFLVVSGHDEAAFRSAIGAVNPSGPNGVTVVILMGIARASALAAALVERGWSRRTPVACVFAASTPRQQTWIGDLDDVVSQGLALSSDDAGTLIVGDVVSKRGRESFSSGTDVALKERYVAR